MMRMLWVMMGMYVPFVAPSLTLKRCPCVTSVNCNIVRIALTHMLATSSGYVSNHAYACWAGSSRK